MNSFAERLRYLRGKKNSKDFAELIGIGVGSLSSYEQGKSIPKMNTIIRISEILGVTTEWLLHGDVQPVDGTAPPAIPKGTMVDLDVVYDVVETIEEILQSTGRVLTPGDKAEVIRQACMLIIEHEAEHGSIRPSQVVRMINNALAG